MSDSPAHRACAAYSIHSPGIDDQEWCDRSRVEPVARHLWLTIDGDTPHGPSLFAGPGAPGWHLDRTAAVVRHYMVRTRSRLLVEESGGNAGDAGQPRDRGASCLCGAGGLVRIQPGRSGGGPGGDGVHGDLDCGLDVAPLVGGCAGSFASGHQSRGSRRSGGRAPRARRRGARCHRAGDRVGAVGRATARIAGDLVFPAAAPGTQSALAAPTPGGRRCRLGMGFD